MASTKKLPKKNKAEKLAHIFTLLGLGSLTAGFILALAVLYPVLKLEFKYSADLLTQSDSQSVEVSWPNQDFAIYIPKIDAISSVVADVDPYDSQVYQRALTQGVAHAQGTAKPGQGSNIFIFSHSSANFFEANRYNSVFYLLNKLETGDQIQVYFNDTLYTYTVSEKKLVSPTQVEYLNGSSETETLTLMTCWPPGTSAKRLIIVANLLQ